MAVRVDRRVDENDRPDDFFSPAFISIDAAPHSGAKDCDTVLHRDNTAGETEVDFTL